MMHLTEYETTIVVRPDVPGDAIEAILSRMRDVVKNGGGKFLAINHWGKRKLAYLVKKQTRGIYVHTSYLGGAGLVAELERNLRIADNVIRFLTVRLAKDVDPSKRSETAYVPPKYDDLHKMADEAEEKERLEASDSGDSYDMGPEDEMMSDDEEKKDKE